MKQEIKNFFLGQVCRRCESSGVICVQNGLISTPGNIPSEPITRVGETAIYVDGAQAFRTSQSIDKCPVITGENTQAEVVKNIRYGAGLLEGRSQY